MDISALTAASGYQKLAQGASRGPADGADGMTSRFSAMFERADDSVKGYAEGRIGAQSVVEAIAEAELALQTAITVRDRVLGAYQELLRMPL